MFSLKGLRFHRYYTGVGDKAIGFVIAEF